MVVQRDQKIRAEIRDALPFKAKKYGWPYILWIEPTKHKLYSDNDKRKIFIQKLHKINNLHEESIVLALDQQDWSSTSEMFIEREKRYTIKGLRAIWSSIDKTIIDADTRVLRNHGKSLNEVFKQDGTLRQDDRFNKFGNRTRQSIQDFQRRSENQNRQQIEQPRHHEHSPFRRTGQTRPSFRHYPMGSKLPAPHCY